MNMFSPAFQKLIGNDVPETPEVIVIGDPAIESLLVDAEKLVREAENPIPLFTSRFIATEDFFSAISGLTASAVRSSATLQTRSMVEAFRQVIEKYSLSAPVADIIHSVPSFKKLGLESFPTSDDLDIIPVAESSPILSTALESLMTSSSDDEDPMVSSMKDMISNFSKVMDTASYQATQLEPVLIEAKKYIEDLDADEDVLAELSVNTLSSEAFDKVLGMLEKYIVTVSAFGTSSIRENPESLKEEIDGLNAVVDEVSHVFGIVPSEAGLTFGDKDETFSPSEGTLGSHGISKTFLMFYLDKAWSIINQVKIICEKKDEYVSALYGECEAMPAPDSGYCSEDHCCMITSYITLVSKLVIESIIVASRLVSVVSAVKNTETMNPETDSAGEM